MSQFPHEPIDLTYTFMITQPYIAGLFCGVVLTLSLAPYLHAQNSSKIVLVHYAPWFASKPVSGHWAWHWTMNNFNPDEVKANGQREIASHHYPLIGPYDSNDPHALECQVLLMKFAGLDGAIIDWYGIEEVANYDIFHRNTQHLVKHLKRAGLQFAIMYEDRTLQLMVDIEYLPPQEDVTHGQKIMKWLADNWFGDEAYVKLNQRPVLLVFGPLYFTKEQWTQVRSGISPQPMIYGLPGLSQKTGLDGAFGWIPVGGGRHVMPPEWRNYLEYIYNELEEELEEPTIAIAFPGFHDIYKQAGSRPSFGFIDHRDGETFAETFDLALKSNSPIIQIATWNDYGEGTVIEPTREFGYRYLEHIQKHADDDFPYGPDALRLPIILYQLKKRHEQRPARMQELERATDLLFAGKYNEGRSVIEAVVEEQLIASDVNRDGTVNILDLLSVVQQLGQSVPADSPADVTGDGVVNIIDLVEVAQNFENTPASAYEQ